MASVTIFLPSQQEVDAVWSFEPVLESCRRLAAFGPEVVVIKMGDAGSLVWSREMEQGWHVPIYRTDVVDTTGAGDAFCGAFSATYTQTRDPRASAVSGTVAASFVIEEFGGLHALDSQSTAVERRSGNVNERVEVLEVIRGEE